MRFLSESPTVSDAGRQPEQNARTRAERLVRPLRRREVRTRKLAGTLLVVVLSLACSPDSTNHEACTFEVLDASYSPAIGTVGIVKWRSSLSSMARATIEFGVDSTYELTAPVDVTRDEFRTLLLGMKANAGPYHFRIQAEAADGSLCTSPDYSFADKTEPAPSDLATPSVVTHDASGLFGGFFLSVGFEANTPDDYVFILDGDGDPVWWYAPKAFGDLTVARMSYDGQYMWIGHANVPSVEGRVGRVSMDGTEWQDLRAEFTKQNHDLTVLPDETVAYLAYAPNECDDLVLRSPNGTKQTLFNAADAFGNPIVCHCNALQYSPEDDTFVVSDNDHRGYFKVDRRGNLIWVLGGEDYNSFDKSGGGASDFAGNHNFHLLGLDRLVFFNNGTQGALVEGVAAVARELTLDLQVMTTTEVWSYSASPAVTSPILGDVQRLGNGNTLVTYSSGSVVHEVNPEGKLLQEWRWDNGQRLGYATKRATLYGPPPR